MKKVAAAKTTSINADHRGNLHRGMGAIENLGVCRDSTRPKRSARRNACEYDGPVMRIYLLQPQDETAEDWAGSTYCGPVYVEAFDAEEARHVAGQFFATPTPLVPGMRTIYRPWWSHALVDAFEVNAMAIKTCPFISMRDLVSQA